jgi:DNA invertase Pin-like site-specific DNA recombinase
LDYYWYTLCLLKVIGMCGASIHVAVRNAALEDRRIRPMATPAAILQLPLFRKPSFSEDGLATRGPRLNSLQKLLQKPCCFKNRRQPFSDKIRLMPDDNADLLVPEPIVQSEIRIGYARVSTGGQNLERQIDALKAADCRRIFADKKSGRDAQRPELAACHAFLHAGDTLVVPSLDRYGRSLQDLITMVSELRRREVGFTSLHESLDTTTPGGRLIFHVFAALAEFIRELIVQGTREGLAAARARGRIGGRPSVMTPDIISAARDLLPDPDRSITSIAKLLGVSPGTLYNHIPDIRELRGSDGSGHM